MAPAMYVVQAADLDVRINLRRRHARVPQQLLHHAQVRAPLEQVRREAVTQRVRADPPRDPASRRTSRHTAVRSIAPPVRLKNSGRPAATARVSGSFTRPAATAFSISFGRSCSTYASSASRAAEPTGVTRSRRPLPKHRTNPAARFTSPSRSPHNSLTRSPLE